MNNLHLFGIAAESILAHNESSFISIIDLAKFLEQAPTQISQRADRIINDNNLDKQKVIKHFNIVDGHGRICYSEELVYLIIMTLQKCQRAAEIRSQFAQVLCAKNLSLTLPFPKNQIEDIKQKIDEAKLGLNYLSEELEKSLSL
jgi:hypothetical protein